jgi:hypothetical protein
MGGSMKKEPTPYVLERKLTRLALAVEKLSTAVYNLSRNNGSPVTEPAMQAQDIASAIVTGDDE